MRFYTSVRLAVKKGESHKNDKGVIIGNRMKIKAVKNKVGFPFRETEFSLYYLSGIDVIGDLFDVGVAEEVISKSGNNYSFGETKLGLGRDKSLEVLAKDRGTRDKIEGELIKKEKEDFPCTRQI